jgi:MFS transporter, DHA1 family, inner membrane transport protein
MDKRLAWLAIGTFTISTVGFVFAGLLPAIAAETGVSVARAGYIVTAYALAYALGAPVLSAMFGASDRRRLLAASMLVFVAGNGIASASPYFALLVTAQIVMGASAGLFVATAQATAVALSEPEHRARAISIVIGGTTVAVAFGAPLGSLIAALWGWRGTFLAVAVLGLLCAAVLWWRLPRGLAGTPLTLRERLKAIGRPGVPSSLLLTLIYLTGGFVIIAYLAPLAMEGAGLPELAVPAILLAFGIGAIVGNLASGYLSDRIGATRVIMLSLATSFAVCIAIATGLRLLPQDLAGPLLIAIMVPWGMIGWAFPPAQGSRLTGFAPDVAHLTLSLNVSALYFGIALGTIVGGRVLEFGEPADLALVAAVFPVIALIVLALGARAVPASAPSAAE